jgi:hypothetical protein
MFAKLNINFKRIFIWYRDNSIESKKNKPRILFINHYNIEEEWNKKTIKKLNDHKQKNKYKV